MNKEVIGSQGKQLELVTGNKIIITRGTNSIVIDIEDIKKLLNLIK